MKKKRWILASGIISITILLLLVACAWIHDPNKNVESFQMEQGTLGQEEASKLLLKIEEKFEGKVYYSGCYCEDGNVVILLKVGYEEKEEKIYAWLGTKKNVYVSYARYSKSELEEALEDIIEKLQAFEREERKGVLGDVLTGGIDLEKNVIYLGVRGLSPTKESLIRLQLGHWDMILFKPVEAVVG